MLARRDGELPRVEGERASIFQTRSVPDQVSSLRTHKDDRPKAKQHLLLRSRTPRVLNPLVRGSKAIEVDAPPVDPQCPRSLVPSLIDDFLDSPQIPYPAKIRRVRGTEHVRASGPVAVTIGLQYVQIERSASLSGPCTTSIPLTRCPGSIAASWELVADAPAVTDSATKTMETNHRRTPNILSRRVLR